MSTSCQQHMLVLFHPSKKKKKLGQLRPGRRVQQHWATATVWKSRSFIHRPPDASPLSGFWRRGGCRSLMEIARGDLSSCRLWPFQPLRNMHRGQRGVSERAETSFCRAGIGNSRDKTAIHKTLKGLGSPSLPTPNPPLPRGCVAGCCYTNTVIKISKALISLLGDTLAKKQRVVEEGGGVRSLLLSRCWAD